MHELLSVLIDHVGQSTRKRRFRGAQPTSLAHQSFHEPHPHPTTTPATVRKLALSFPETEDLSHHGKPDFRVRGKIFAALPVDGGRSVVKLTLEDQADLVKSDPRAFSLNLWSRDGWTNVHLAHVTAAQFREIPATSWRFVSLRKMAVQYDEEDL